MISKRRKQTFVLVVPRFEDISHSFYAGEILRGVGLGSSRLKVDILFHITDRFDHRGWLDSTLLDRNYIDGIIFADIDNDLNVVRKVLQHEMPCIVLNNMLEEPINCVWVDNYTAAFSLTEHLIHLGHKKIATIAGDLSTQAGQMRLKGFGEALEKHDLNLPKNYISYGDFLRTPARVAAQELLKLKSMPTAIFAASDVMALEVFDVAKSLKIRVPEDLSVIGFDNNPISYNSSIGLSTVNQPLIEMGRLGVEHLHQIVKGRTKPPVKVVLTTQFIERKSTTALTASGSRS